MAAGNWTEFTQAALKIASGAMDLAVDNFRLILVTNSYVPAPNTDATYANVSAYELPTGGGYTLGGLSLASETLTASGGTVTWTCAAVNWSSFTDTLRYGVIVHCAAGSGGSLASTDLLVAYSDLGGGTSITGGGGAFSVTESGTGILQFTHNP